MSCVKGVLVGRSTMFNKKNINQLLPDNKRPAHCFTKQQQHQRQQKNGAHCLMQQQSPAQGSKACSKLLRIIRQYLLLQKQAYMHDNVHMGTFKA